MRYANCISLSSLFPSFFLVLYDNIFFIYLILLLVLVVNPCRISDLSILLSARDTLDPFWHVFIVT